ncbi:hypothetical protein AB1Y20_004019 [Prymnesium parvum]|uniref:Uncharacterized protein n=1 Tax=Prymnesium parvum TaxID=97485 RepID=A0AB34J5I5_PRYPA
MYLPIAAACGAAAKTGELSHAPPRLASSTAAAAAAVIALPSPSRQARTFSSAASAPGASPGCSIATRSSATSSIGLPEARERSAAISRLCALRRVARSAVVVALSLASRDRRGCTARSAGGEQKAAARDAAAARANISGGFERVDDQANQSLILHPSTGDHVIKWPVIRAHQSSPPRHYR